jgi:catechol 2,3-dioxygenase-like lactoylglutathione lyase family enzyme
MMQPIGIDHVVIRVSDLPGMTAFYRDILGCEVAHRQDRIGLVHLRAGPSLIDLVDINGPLVEAGERERKGANMDHLCLRIADFDIERIAIELAAKGVALGPIGERFGSTGEATSLYLTDPEGNGLELRG